MSSAAEVWSHLYVVLDQGDIDQEHFNIIYEQPEKTARMISGLIKYLRTKPNRPKGPNTQDRPDRPDTPNPR